MGELDDVSLVTRCGKEFLHFTNEDDDAAPSVTLFAQHFNEETCEEIKVGEEESVIASSLEMQPSVKSWKNIATTSTQIPLTRAFSAHFSSSIVSAA